MQSLLQNGEKVTPKQWKAEIQSLQTEYDSISKKKSKTATESAYAEVISYNSRARPSGGRKKFNGNSIEI